jgi:hypothetical protein
MKSFPVSSLCSLALIAVFPAALVLPDAHARPAQPFALASVQGLHKADIARNGRCAAPKSRLADISNPMRNSDLNGSGDSTSSKDYRTVAIRSTSFLLSL